MIYVGEVKTGREQVGDVWAGILDEEGEDVDPPELRLSDPKPTLISTSSDHSTPHLVVSTLFPILAVYLVYNLIRRSSRSYTQVFGIGNTLHLTY